MVDDNFARGETLWCPLVRGAAKRSLFVYWIGAVVDDNFDRGEIL